MDREEAFVRTKSKKHKELTCLTQEESSDSRREKREREKIKYKQIEVERQKPGNSLLTGTLHSAMDLSNSQISTMIELSLTSAFESAAAKLSGTNVSSPILIKQVHA